jgi:hypothetical protein
VHKQIPAPLAIHTPPATENAILGASLESKKIPLSISLLSHNISSSIFTLYTTTQSTFTIVFLLFTT